MKQLHFLFPALLALSITTSAAVPAMAGDSTVRNSDSAQDGRKVEVNQTNLSNGFYLIVRESAEKKEVEPVDSTEQLALYDYEFFEPTDRGTMTYVVLAKDKFIPISLSEAPTKEPDGKGRRKLMLQLAKEQIVPLERFTTTNWGKAIAIVIGGKVVTTHKIREPIKGGKIQITRCSDNGCDVLYTQLQGQ
ncbi:MAG: hypothetical protein K2X93_27665 [Candidatus Obscuribacterales bacterium]|nr:hypothetical protein [Candidatus Obscuribacterales bacterium]